MWVLDAGLLTLNARCITKGMVKLKLTSSLLRIANNLLNQVICTRILTSSLVCVCVLSSGYGGSVLITRYQSLDLSAR